MLLIDIVRTSADIAATRSRTQKVARIAETIRRLAPTEIAAGVSFLAGDLRQRQIGVGWATAKIDVSAAAEPSLQVLAVDMTFAQIGALSGTGSQGERRRLVAELLQAATAQEQIFLRAVMLGQLRQGALEGVVTDAVARAADLPIVDVRRARMLAGDLGEVAEAALTRGAAGLATFRLQIGSGILPMLASPGDHIATALERTGTAAIEWKLDGARIQIHRDGDQVAVFTRSLDDITDRVPEVVEAARSLAAESLILDGEVIALRPDGRPQPFQVTASRVGRRADPAALRVTLPLTPFIFDVLHVDGEDLIDAPGADRSRALGEFLPEVMSIPRIVTADTGEAERFLAGAIARGHEGVMVKALDAPYAAGARGAGWLKIKPRHTLDLVVLAAEWGHGRRKGWLSNLHLGARDTASGQFVMLGKTFKGLTDLLLDWQTRELLERQLGTQGITVHVRPELVVEIAFDGVQASSRYPGGMALRFARVLRYRPDKTAAEADTLDAVRAIHEAGLGG